MPRGSMMKGDSMMKAVFEGGGEPPYEVDDMGEEEESEYSPEYMAAYEEYEAAPSAETFWRAVEACVAETKSSGGGGGLALLLSPKGKKK